MLVKFWAINETDSQARDYAFKQICMTLFTIILLYSSNIDLQICIYE